MVDTAEHIAVPFPARWGGSDAIVLLRGGLRNGESYRLKVARITVEQIIRRTELSTCEM